MDPIEIKFNVIYITITRYRRSGCNVSTIDTPRFSLRQPLPATNELLEERIGVPRVEIKAKYKEWRRKQWEDDENVKCNIFSPLMFILLYSFTV